MILLDTAIVVAHLKGHPGGTQKIQDHLVQTAILTIVLAEQDAATAQRLREAAKGAMHPARLGILSAELELASEKKKATPKQ